MSAISYAVENDLGVEEFIDVLKRSTLAERRPVAELGRIGKMLSHANLIVAARNDDGLLIGVSRCLTDFAFCCFCSDLAVDAAYQGQGIGERLLDISAAEAGEHAHFILLSAPKAIGFYEKIGMVRHPACFERPGWKRFAEKA
jgi:ribosomal protein S18 acetylase RimI-like enzyme